MSNTTVLAGLRSSLGICAAVAALGLSAGAHAQDAGMVAVRDAETGQLRAPTAEELSVLQAGEQARLNALKPSERAARASRMVARTDGVRQKRLGDSAAVYSVLTRGADGSATMQCVDGASAAEAAVKGGAAAATVTSKEHQHDAQ